MTTPSSSASPSDYDPLATVDAIFTAVADRYLTRVAVEDESHSLTYGELATASTRLADQLVEAGAAPGVAIGISVDRSVSHVVCLLAVLRAGAHYVPLPLDSPVRRREQISDSADVRLIVVGEAESDGTPEGLGRPVVRCDLAALLMPSPPRALPAQGRQGSADEVAYVMFTSGSNGSPKGVAVTHRNIVRLVRGQKYVEFGPRTTFLHLASTAFDASTFEIWGALLNGGRLVVAPPGLSSLDALTPLFTQRGVTTAFITTALYHEMIDLRPELLTQLEWLLVGGEPMSVSRALRGVDLLGERIANIYGPTEATTFSSYFPLIELDPEATSVPIGRSIEHGQVLVLDDELAECAPGTVGEIVVTGDGVASGYVGDPELTAAKFPTDAAKFAQGAAIYRTGDRGRLLPSGAIEFLGRLDEQVKIRGYRIEPAEIEAVLEQHESVRRAAVVVVHRPDASDVLVAFLVPAGPQPPDPTALMTFAGQLLPAYMVPWRIEFLDSLPLTSNGKVDKAQLQSIAKQPASTVTDLPTLTPTMATLARLWRLVLPVSPTTVVDADSDFFVLGGDSLLVLRLMAAAEEAGLPISVSDVFHAPMLSELAALADGHQRTSGAAESSIAAEVDEETYPATQMQLGMIYEAEASDDGSLYHDGISVTVAAQLDLAALEATFAFLAGRHEALRTRFDLSGFDQAMQVVEASPRIPVSASATIGYPEDMVERELSRRLAELMRPFDVESEPLFRVHAVQLDSSKFQLLFAFHHAIMDGWSESVLLTEFSIAYPSYCAGRTPTLDPKPRVRYRELSRLEQAALADPDEVRYWREVIAQMTPTCVRHRSDELGTRGSGRIVEHRELPGRLSAGLASVARSVGMPIKSVLLAGHLAVVAEATGSDQVSTGLVVNGRPERPDADRMVGLFLNTLPISADLAGASWRTLVHAVFEAERELLPHRWYPYPALAREAGGDLFDTVFNFVQFHLYGAARPPGSVEISNQQISDKASVPLMVDVVREPRGEGIRFEFIAESPLWSPESLRRLADTYLRLYDSLLADPDAVAISLQRQAK